PSISSLARSSRRISLSSSCPGPRRQGSDPARGGKRVSQHLEPYIRCLARPALLRRGGIAAGHSVDRDLGPAAPRLGIPAVPPRRQLPVEGRRRRARDLDSSRAPGDGRPLPLLPQPDVPRAPDLSRGARYCARLVARRGGVRVPRRVVRPARARRRDAPHCSFRGSLPRVSRARETLDPRSSLRSFTETIPPASINAALAQNTGASPDTAPIPPNTSGMEISVI